MARVPALRKNLVAFRDKNDSSRQNQFQEDVFFDLMQAFTDLNAQRTQIRDMMEVVTTENKFLQLRLRELQSQLAQLPILPDADGKYTATVFVSNMRSEAETAGAQPLAIDALHGIATLPLAKDGRVSKVYLTDALTGEPFVPETTGILALPAADGIAITDTNLRAALDGQDRTAWVRKVRYALDADVDQVEVTVTITLPENIISTRDVNTITIHPFPIQSVDVVNVELGLNDVWTQVPGFTPRESSGPLRLCFPARPVSQVRVTLRQRHWIEESGQKVFYLGAQEIGVFKESYGAPRAEFTVPISLKQGHSSYTIHSITPVFANQAALTGDVRALFSYALYTVNPDTGAVTYAQDQLPAVVKQPRLLLKATLYADSQTGATPALEAVMVRYTT